METLLDLADALVASSMMTGNQPELPDFDIPEEYANIPTTDQYLELRGDDNDSSNVVGTLNGKGWYAKCDLPPGTLLMVAKPIAMVMDWEDDSKPKQDSLDDGIENMETNDDDDDEEETEGRLNELLYLEILGLIRDNPQLWTERLSTMFPRDKADVSSLPAAWMIADDDLFGDVERAIQDLRDNCIPPLRPNDINDIVKRLPLIIRYNVLSVETCSELLSYPGPNGHASLSGVGLYYLPSFFNHSCTPNCNRWSVGDVMGIVTNQTIPKGTEVCISYIEHDVLCENAKRRNRLLNMDFTVTDDDNTNNNNNNQHDTTDTRSSCSNETDDNDDDDGPNLPVVDTDVQNELMGMDPFSRLQAIDELMQQALGVRIPDGEACGGEIGVSQQPPIDEDVPMPDPVGWFQCDIHNLRILRAITLDGMGQTDQALNLWEDSIRFVEEHLPPHDESLVVLRVQAALCAYHLYSNNKESSNGTNPPQAMLEKAQYHANKALETHALLFGDGVQRFRRRFKHDLELKLRPSSTIVPQPGPGAVSPVDYLWPIVAT